MSKRLIDCNLFEDDWVHGLSKDGKLFFIYYIITCDHAGILKLNKSSCEFQTGIKEFERVIKELGNRLVTLKEGLYFMPKFIQYQYPGFPKSNVRQQEGAIKLLQSVGITLEKLMEHLANSQVTLNKELATDMYIYNKDNAINKERYDKFISLFNKITKRNFKGDDDSRGKLNARLRDGYTPAQIQTAIEICANDKWHMENPKYLTPEFILRPAKLQMYLNAKPTQTEEKKVGKDGVVWDGDGAPSADWLNIHT